MRVLAIMEQVFNSIQHRSAGLTPTGASTRLRYVCREIVWMNASVTSVASFERLPLAVERQERTDLEVAGGDVERPGDAGPLLEIAEPGPARDAVVAMNRSRPLESAVISILA